MPKQGELIVGLDVGTSKVTAVVGEVDDTGGVNILGAGVAASRGLSGGAIVNIEATVDSIRKAVAEAEERAHVRIDTVYAGIAGGHIRSFQSHGVVALKHGEVTLADLEHVHELTRAAAIPHDQSVLHLIPQQYVVDAQDGIKHPLGICGVRLEAEALIVTAARGPLNNLVKCINLAGLRLADVVLEPLAASRAVLTEEEREIGTCLVDLGGGTTDLAIFNKGALAHTSVIGWGGIRLTKEIATGLRTPVNEAERLKRKFGAAVSAVVPADEQVEVPSVADRNPRSLSRRVLTEVLEDNLEELFRLVAREIQASGLESELSGGIVLTGGGALLPSIEDLAEDILGVVVRRGDARHVTGVEEVVRDPSFATAVGLVASGLRVDEQRFLLGKPPPGLPGLVRRLRSWVAETF